MFPEMEPGEVRQRVLFDDGRLVVGEFIWNARTIGERRKSVTGIGHLLVVPWSPVRITHEGREPIVAEPRTVVFYQPRQAYQAEQLVERAERSYFIGMSRETLAECLTSSESCETDEILSAFAAGHGPCPEDTFL